MASRQPRNVRKIGRFHTMGNFILIYWQFLSQVLKVNGLVPFSVTSEFRRLLEALLEAMDLNIKWGHVACLDVGFNGQGNKILVYNCDLTTWRSLYGF